MKPEIRVGQTWEKAHNDGPSSKPTRIRVLDVRHRGQNLTVATVTPDGRLVRRRTLLGSALTNTPAGYMLAKEAPAPFKPGVDAPPEAKAEPLSERDMAEAEYARLEGTPTAAPSPLEVVRQRLSDGIPPCQWRQSGEAYDCDPEPQGARCVYCKARDTVDLMLATLEESIRADIAEYVFAMLRGEVALPGRTCKSTMATASNATAVADAVRARRK